MKKLLIVLVVVSLIVIGYAYDQFLWCKKLITGEPTTHTIKRGEHLSKIAKKYYGDASYWRELAMVNRAPDSDVVFPEEKIIIPSLDVVKKIRRTRWLSKVNGYIKEQEDILANLHKESEYDLSTGESKTTPTAEPQVTVSEPAQLSVEVENMEENNRPVKSSSTYVVLVIIGLVLVGGVITFILYRIKKRQEREIAFYNRMNTAKA